MFFHKTIKEINEQRKEQKSRTKKKLTPNSMYERERWEQVWKIFYICIILISHCLSSSNHLSSMYLYPFLKGCENVCMEWKNLPEWNVDRDGTFRGKWRLDLTAGVNLMRFSKLRKQPRKEEKTHNNDSDSISRIYTKSLLCVLSKQSHYTILFIQKAYVNCIPWYKNFLNHILDIFFFPHWFLLFLLYIFFSFFPSNINHRNHIWKV